MAVRTAGVNGPNFAFLPMVMDAGAGLRGEMLEVRGVEEKTRAELCTERTGAAVTKAVFMLIDLR